MTLDNIRKIGENINNLSGFKGSVTYDVPLFLHTTMRVGGAAAVFVEPADGGSLAAAVNECRRNQVPYYVLGGGSNVIFSDGGFMGVILHTGSIGSITCSGLDSQGTARITCGAGAKTCDLAEFAAANGIEGFTDFAGLPGTVGGACYMNARCYENDFCTLVESIEYLDAETGSVRTYCVNPADWGYKKSPFMGRNAVILSVCFAGRGGVKASEELCAMNENRVQDRRAKGHFKAPSAGSVFKNNRAFGKSSGAIIDGAGLKGICMGGAQVAPWHGNFIINAGNATAKDVKALVEFIQREVEAKTSFRLEPEIIFVN